MKTKTAENEMKMVASYQYLHIFIQCSVLTAKPVDSKLQITRQLNIERLNLLLNKFKQVASGEMH